GKTGLSEDYWMTDITISHRSWSYIQGHTYKTPDLVIRNMIDVWSKRGVVLLNISPTADGEIPASQRSVLLGIGAWIDQHEEAIYGTRAHHIHGYGDAAFEKGHFGGQSATIDYSQSDIRFTKAKDGNSLYVFSLGMPAPNAKLAIKEIKGPENSLNVAGVSVLGSGTPVSWSFENELLTINTPEAALMDSISTVFKVELN
ncbi:MAG: alpha-L-fucosidase, partial [Bacteroidota bacterium]